MSALRFLLRKPSTPVGVVPAPVRRLTGAGFDTDWARRPSARVARKVLVNGVMGPVIGGLATPSVRGLDRLEDLEGPVVFAANHHSHLDTPLLLRTIPSRFSDRLVVGAAADYFFGNVVSGSLAALALGAFPVERTMVGRKSADTAAELIADDFSLLLFPEGGRSPDGWGQDFRGGAAYLALRCGVPIVPIHIEGTGRILPKGRSLPRSATTTVTFGTPIHPADGERSQALTTRVESAVATLADEDTNDWYSAQRRAHEGSTPALRGPQTGAWRRIWALDASRPGRSRPTWPKKR